MICPACCYGLHLQIQTHPAGLPAGCVCIFTMGFDDEFARLRESPRRALDIDPAQFCELIERGLSAETSVATAFDAAERNLRFVVDGLVADVHHAGFKTHGDIQCAVEIFCDNTG